MVGSWTDRRAERRSLGVRGFLSGSFSRISQLAPPRRSKVNLIPEVDIQLSKVVPVCRLANLSRPDSIRTSRNQQENSAPPSCACFSVRSAPRPRGHRNPPCASSRRYSLQSRICCGLYFEKKSFCLPWALVLAAAALRRRSALRQPRPAVSKRHPSAKLPDRTKLAGLISVRGL